MGEEAEGVQARGKAQKRSAPQDGSLLGLVIDDVHDVDLRLAFELVCLLRDGHRHLFLIAFLQRHHGVAAKVHGGGLAAQLAFVEGDNLILGVRGKEVGGAGRRVVAVGTTTVRTLEYAARNTPHGVIPSDEPASGEKSRGLYSGVNSPNRRVPRSGLPLARAGQLPNNSAGHITAQRGEANIFIYPGFEFRVVGAMLTNFHLPKSTLLMLVSAFAGREPILRAYHHAVQNKYRFYSYGDCMFVE